MKTEDVVDNTGRRSSRGARSAGLLTALVLAVTSGCSLFFDTSLQPPRSLDSGFNDTGADVAEDVGPDAVDEDVDADVPEDPAEDPAQDTPVEDPVDETDLVDDPPADAPEDPTSDSAGDVATDAPTDAGDVGGEMGGDTGGDLAGDPSLDTPPCGEATPNACGGCGVLLEQPGAPCGGCGAYACDGTDWVACQPTACEGICPACDLFTYQALFGGEEACGLRLDGTPACWGGSSAMVPPPGRFEDLGQGIDYFCGLRPGGHADCVGPAGFDINPPAAERLSDLVIGSEFACALDRDSEATCWERGGGTQLEPPAGVVFTALSAGVEHACGLRDNHQIDCWGVNPDGRADDQSGDYFAVAAGATISCAILTSDKSMTCWGALAALPAAPTGPFDQLDLAGDVVCGRLEATREVECYDASGPATAPAGVFRTIVGVGEGLHCGLRHDGSVECWGASAERPSGHPPRAGYSALAMHAWGTTTCLIDGAGSLECWAAQDQFGETGPPGGTNFVQVAVGSEHGCAVTDTGAVSCWGASGNSTVLTPTPDSDPYVEVAVGEAFSCGRLNTIDPDNLLCWGTNNTNSLLTPASGSYDEVDAGQNHACARASDGSVACWGQNNKNQATPPAATDFDDLGLADRTSCGVRTSDGNIACWGNDATWAATGDHDAVAAANDHFCALLTDATLACYENDDVGQSSPPDGSYTKVAVGDGRSCALRDDTQVICWGALARGLEPVTDCGGGDVNECGGCAVLGDVVGGACNVGGTYACDDEDNLTCLDP